MPGDVAGGDRGQSTDRSPSDFKAATISAWQELIERKEQSAGMLIIGIYSPSAESHRFNQERCTKHAKPFTSPCLRNEDDDQSAFSSKLFEV